MATAEAPNAIDLAGDGDPGHASAVSAAAWISAVAAAYFTLVYYPGVLYSDSYARWQLAHGLVQGDPGRTNLSVGPSLWMAAAYALTGNYAAFTLLQSFLYFFSTLLVVTRLGSIRGAWVAVPAAALILFPLFPGYAVFHEGGVGTAIGMNLLFVIALWRPRPGRANAVLRGAALFLAAFAILSFRQNAITVVPAAALLLWRAAPSRPERISRQAILAASIGAALVMSAVLGTRGGGSGIGLAWEIVGTLKRVQGASYDHYLDYAGDTRAAVAANIENGVWDGLVSPQTLPFDRLLDRSVCSRLKRDYVRLAVAEPAAFVANKWTMARRTLGIGQPLYFYEFDENRFGRMAEFGYRDTPQRHRQFQRVEAVGRWAFPRTPWLVFLAGAGLWWAARRLPRRPPFAGLLLAFGALYYGAFLLTTQAYEFRYFFPSFHLVAVLGLVVATGFSREGLARLRSALASRRRAAG